MSGPSLFDLDPPAASSDGAAARTDDSALPEADGGGIRATPQAETQSLYRKYRPQTFDGDELVGQEHVVRTLRNAILLDRVAHAYLFCGPRGTGKTTTARLLAKAVNCLHADPAERPCNACASCRAITSGAATDVIEIDAASNRGIDDIRDLRERVKYAPTQLRTKFYIVDEAHQITGAAANAFLKTLEEPPGHTKFVLATTDPEELLPTIVSRCQRFDFRRVGLEAMVARLRVVAAAERLTVDDEALEVIARNATGSLRDALGLLDQLAVFREGGGAADVDEPAVITANAVRALLGVSRNDRIETLVAAIADRDAGAALGTVNDAVEAGEDPRQLNRQLVAYLRVLLHQRAAGSRDADERARLLADRFELIELAALARRFGEIEYKIKHSSFPQLPLEVALIESILRPDGELGGVSSEVSPAAAERDAGAPANDAADLNRLPPRTALRDQVRGRDEPRPAPTAATPARSAPPRAVRERTAPVPAPPAPNGALDDTGAAGSADVADAAPAVIDVERIVDLWPRIRQDVKALSRQIEALLREIDPVAVQGDQVLLQAPYEFHRNRINADDVRSVIEDVISRLIGRGVRVTCVLRGEAPQPAGRFLPPEPANPPAPMETSESVPATVAEATPADPEPLPVTVVPADTATDSAELDAIREADERRLRAAKNIFDAEELR